MKRALLLIFALAACDSEKTTPLAPLGANFRDDSVLIASKADFDPAKFAGEWYEVARFPNPFQAGCAGSRVTYAAQEDGTLAVANTCIDIDGADLRTINGSATVSGPGRLQVRLNGVPFAAPLWVLWTDADYRVAVLGQPDGRGGWILSRERGLRRDLDRAAREVLDFNGYNTDRLREARVQ